MIRGIIQPNECFNACKRHEMKVVLTSLRRDKGATNGSSKANGLWFRIDVCSFRTVSLCEIIQFSGVIDNNRWSFLSLKQYFTQQIAFGTSTIHLNYTLDETKSLDATSNHMFAPSLHKNRFSKSGSFFLSVH